ncbi:MAG: SPOR domain-containing protein [Gillisia sp.]
MRILKLKDCFFMGVLLLGISSSLSAQTGQINIQQNDLIPELLSLKSEMTKDGKLGERYTIQLYYGNNNAASNVIKEFRAKYNSMPSSVVYETPNYKVWVGKFRNRLEADRALLKIKADFPSAFIPKPQRG